MFTNDGTKIKLEAMEFKRNRVIALHSAGKCQKDIIRELKVKRNFVYRAIKRYNDTGSIARRHGGGPGKTANRQK